MALTLGDLSKGGVTYDHWPDGWLQVTGLAAKQGMIRHGANTIQNVLRVVGTSEDEGQGQPSSASGSGGVCRPNWEGGQARFFVQRGEKTVQVTADEVITHLFTLLKGKLQII